MKTTVTLTHKEATDALIEYFDLKAGTEITIEAPLAVLDNTSSKKISDEPPHPLLPDTEVEVLFKCGVESVGPASYFNWGGGQGDFTIVSYKILKNKFVIF